jgi:uncharacterized protein (TIGR03083 family)
MAPDPTLLGDVDPYELMDREAARLDVFFSTLPETGWSRPTACADWNVRDMLGHLAASEEYNHACLADDVSGLMARVGARGVTDMNSFNALGVADMADRSPQEALDEWRRVNGETRQRMRERRGGELATMVGAYSMDWQAWHLANELAVHADDIGVPVEASEAADRAAWLTAFARFATTETGKGVTIEPVERGYRVSVGDVEAVLSAEDLVAAVNARELASGAELPEALASALRMM